ncbi:uncharacterized protein LOC128514229 [Clarias gariepinus]|uniref:uncharacterized protein LOC128514229 n=1 Tax=Clarias gariepinus TaxID=13013 RepID=UPI00234D1EAA|nr:uncharacterized protein LOC128514229 [Clarias gariepinus]
MRLPTRKDSIALFQPFSRKQEEEEEEEEEEEMRVKSRHTHQVSDAEPGPSCIMQETDALNVENTVLSPLRDRPQTSASAKANETALAVRSDKGGDVASNIPPKRHAPGQRKQESNVIVLSSSDPEPDSESSGAKKAKKEKSHPKKAKKMGKKLRALAVRSDKGGDVASNIPPKRQAPGQRKQESNVIVLSSSDSEPDSESLGAKKAKKKKSHPKKGQKNGQEAKSQNP